MELGNITFNNLVESNDWKMSSRISPQKRSSKKLLVLAAKILKKFGDTKSGSVTKETKAGQLVEQTYHACRVNNPKN